MDFSSQSSLRSRERHHLLPELEAPGVLPGSMQQKSIGPTPFSRSCRTSRLCIETIILVPIYRPLNPMTTSIPIAARSHALIETYLYQASYPGFIIESLQCHKAPRLLFYGTTIGKTGSMVSGVFFLEYGPKDA
jgi:hypothetical protein